MTGIHQLRSATLGSCDRMVTVTSRCLAKQRQIIEVLHACCALAAEQGHAKAQSKSGRMYSKADGMQPSSNIYFFLKKVIIIRCDVNISII